MRQPLLADYETDVAANRSPLSAAPRYVSNEDACGVGLTPGEWVSPPAGLAVPHGFTFAAEVKLPGGAMAPATLNRR